MTFEPPHNSFRAQLRGGAAANPLVIGKRPRGGRTARSLTGKTVSRQDFRQSNSRDDDRHRLVNADAFIRKGRRSYRVHLINISAGGAMVEGELPARLWQIVTLVLGELGEIECAVRWIRDDRYGLEFAHETRVDCDAEVLNELLSKVVAEAAPACNEVQAAYETSAGQPPAQSALEVRPRRKAERHPLVWSGIVRFGDSSVVARLRNISTTGAQIQSIAAFTLGTKVILELGNAGTVSGRVCWCHEDAAGVAFDQPFDVSLLAKIKPEIICEGWLKPEYLADTDILTSPWASQWGRLSLQDLKYLLRK